MNGEETEVDRLRARLTRVLDERVLWDLRHQRYYEGRAPLEFIAPEVKAATKDRLTTLAIPWARVVIAAIEERLTVTGFRTSRDVPADDLLWRIWQRNDLDEASGLVHTEALVLGRSYALVWGDGQGKATVTAESAKQCAVIHDPATRRPIAGMKRWAADGVGRCVLLLPDRIILQRAMGAVVTEETLSGATWETSEVLPNPLRSIPLVQITNRPTITDPRGQSELADLRPLLDALTKIATDSMVAAESHAGPRRFATGLILEEEEDPITGAPSGNVGAGHRFADLPGRLWVAEDPQAKFGQFPGSDLLGFVNLAGMLKRDLGAVASLPAHYLGQHGDQPSSADAIRSAESSLVALVRRKALGFSGSWEEVMRLAHAVEVGYFDPSLDRLETIWSDFETRTVAQAMDAAAKGVSTGILDADFAAEHLLDLTPTEAARNASSRRGKVVDAAAAALIGSA